MRYYSYNYLYNAEDRKGGGELLYEHRLFSFLLTRVWYSNLMDDPRHHQSSMHTHPYTEVRFMLKGKGIYGVSGSRYMTVNAGEFIVFPAGAEHCILHEEGCFCKFGFNYVFTPKACDGENLYAQLNEHTKNGKIYRYSHNAAIHIDQILWLAENPNCDYETNLLFLALSLFMDLMNTVAADLDRTEPVREVRVRKAVKFINDTISSNTNARQVAGQVDLSVKQLNRLFTAELGETVSTFIEGAKRKKIRELLLDPKLSLEDIAHIMQYNDRANFVRAFKRAEGITPRQFRKAMKVDHI